MKKMSSMFVREGRPYLAIDEYHPDATWVANGEGVATRKWDGTACMVKDGRLFCRRHRKFIPVTADDWNCAWHNQFLTENDIADYEDGTYELCGPSVQANVEGFDTLRLMRHGDIQYHPPRTFHALRDWLAGRDIEGLVWHHPDGRMIKVKKKDFGLPRKPE